MHKEGLVTGMTFGSSAKPDIVCKPCLAGKMQCNPFTSSSSHATQSLELVHSDLQLQQEKAIAIGWPSLMMQPLTAAMKLKQKSDAFEAFKTYKAYAENHFQTKMKEFQDDKGEEYVTCPMHLSDECGIHRCHSTHSTQSRGGWWGRWPHNCDSTTCVEDTLTGNHSGWLSGMTTLYRFLDTDTVASTSYYISIPWFHYVIFPEGSFCLFAICSLSCI